MLESRHFLLVAFSLALKLFGNLLLEDECLESIVTLLLRASKTESEAIGIILLLVNETGKTTILAFVVLNLDLEILRLLGELLSKGLEFEKLCNCQLVLVYDALTYLLLPALQLVDQKVVPLGNFAEFGIHATFEVDKVLPSLESIA